MDISDALEEAQVNSASISEADIAADTSGRTGINDPDQLSTIQEDEDEYMATGP